jgi:type VI protein secretion system component VasF
MPAISRSNATATKPKEEKEPRSKPASRRASQSKPNPIVALAAELGVDVATLKSTRQDDAISLDSDLSELEDD